MTVFHRICPSRIVAATSVGSRPQSSTYQAPTPATWRAAAVAARLAGGGQRALDGQRDDPRLVTVSSVHHATAFRAGMRTTVGQW